MSFHWKPESRHTWPQSVGPPESLLGSSRSQFAYPIDSALTQIESTPERFPRLNERYRYVQLQRFPYFVAYRIEGNVVTVGSIRHASRGDVEFSPEPPSS